MVLLLINCHVVPQVSYIICKKQLQQRKRLGHREEENKITLFFLKLRYASIFICSWFTPYYVSLTLAGITPQHITL